jgi:hypothetical protein
MRRPRPLPVALVLGLDLVPVDDAEAIRRKARSPGARLRREAARKGWGHGAGYGTVKQQLPPTVPSGKASSPSDMAFAERSELHWSRSNKPNVSEPSSSLTMMRNFARA